MFLKIDKEPIYRKLSTQKEVQFFLDGECVTAQLAMSVAEESGYMADYIVGEEGTITQVRFDKID